VGTFFNLPFHDFMTNNIKETFSKADLPSYCSIAEMVYYLAFKVYPLDYIKNFRTTQFGEEFYEICTDFKKQFHHSVNKALMSVMEFTKGSTKIPLLLPQRSLLILTDEARYKWKHSIPARKSNIKQRRVSITFRMVLL
jgi:hypothetical protein